MMRRVFNAQGAFADYFVADSRTSCLVPDAVNFTDAGKLEIFYDRRDWTVGLW